MTALFPKTAEMVLDEARKGLAMVVYGGVRLIIHLRPAGIREIVFLRRSTCPR